MKVAIVIERFDPFGGGMERSTLQIAEELKHRGHAITIIAGSSTNAEAIDFPVVTVFKKRRRGAVSMLRFARRVKGLLAEGDHDTSLSVTTMAPAAVVQPRAGTVRETLNRNIALRATAVGRAKKRAALALSAKQRVMLALERRTLRDPMVRRFAAVSQYVAEQLTKLYGVDPSRIEVIPNAAAMPEVSDAQRAQWRTMVRKGFHIADDVPVFLFAALNPVLKGVNPLMHATRELTDAGLPIVVMLAGYNRYTMQHQAASLGIREQVRFIGPTRKMAALYAAADVTVHPTFYDPSSKVVIESLMMGVPAISTTFNGASDFLTAPDGRARGRVLTDPGDVKALAQAMRELADDAERARCREAIGDLRDELSMKRHVDRLERVLEAAVGLPPSPPGRGPG